MADKVKDTVTGAATGASVGAVGGPWGAAIGGVVGGAGGYFGYMPGTGGGDPADAQDGQLGRNRAFTDALAMQGAANAAAYQPMGVQMAGVPMELGVAATGKTVTMASPYGAPIPYAPPPPAAMPQSNLEKQIAAQREQAREEARWSGGSIPAPVQTHRATASRTPATPSGGGDIGLQTSQALRTGAATPAPAPAPAPTAGQSSWVAAPTGPSYLSTAPAMTGLGGAKVRPRNVTTPQYESQAAYKEATGSSGYAAVDEAEAKAANASKEAREKRLSAPGTTIAAAPDATSTQVVRPGAATSSTAKVGSATAGNVNTDNTDQSRGAFTEALDKVKAAADGTAPSAADRSAALASDKAMARSRGLAASLQGRSVGGALTQAQQSGAEAQANIAATQMANRANEQAVARGQLSEGLTALRAGDISQGTSQAGLNTTTSIANAGNVTQGGISDARGAETVGLGNLSSATSIGITDANNATSTSVGNADRTGRTNIAQGQVSSTEAVAAQDRATREATVLSQLQLQAQQGNQDAQIRLQALADARARGDQDAYLRALGIETSLVSGIDAANAAAKAADNQFLGGLISTGGQVYGAYNAGGGGNTGGGGGSRTSTNYGDGTMSPTMV